MRTVARHLLVLCSLVPGLPGATLKDAFGKIDAAASGFIGLTANMVKQNFTAVINETTSESGTIAVKRPKLKDTRVLMSITTPAPKAYSFHDRTAEIYLPKIQTVQIYNLGKQGALIDQFLLLGFGTPSRDLTGAYQVSLAGEETIGERKAYHLSLLPKSKQVLEQLKTVDLWVDAETGHPVQQKFTEPSGNSTLVTYSNVKVDPGLADSAVRLNLPKNVKREFPQK